MSGVDTGSVEAPAPAPAKPARRALREVAHFPTTTDHTVELALIATIDRLVAALAESRQVKVMPGVHMREEA